ncbi:MAG: NCS2 family permease [Phycisphaerae bacterium]
MNSSRAKYPIWSRGDLDGFFGLMVDNLVQVLLILGLCASPFVAGLPIDWVYARILPGVAISLLVGNLFYGLQAHWVARRDNNARCTALPFGINTPSVFAFAIFVMAPAYRHAISAGADPAAAADVSYKAGLIACLVSGVIEFVGAFFAEVLRRVTPRAALLGALAAIGITFIAADFAFRIFTQPWVALIPFFILLLAYFAHYRFPLGLPGGLIAILVGTASAWLLSIPSVGEWFGIAPARSGAAVRDALGQIRLITPYFAGNELYSILAQPDLLVRYLTISVPMGLINVLGSLQNIESAEAGGDRFRTAPSLAVNGLGTIAAACFGSCFPTTIYIGHPGWKALGARAGYSILNGLFFTVCFFYGLGPLMASLIPIEAGAAIVVYIGVLITAQAFQATPREHAPAVAVALFPALAALLVVKITLAMPDASAGRTLADLLATPPTPSMLPELPGLVALMGANSGWFVMTLIVTALCVALIDRRYRAAAIWAASAAVLTALGLIHAFQVVGNDVMELFIWQKAATGEHAYAYRGFAIAVSYAAAAGIFVLASLRKVDASSGATPVAQVAGAAALSEPRP